MRLAWLGEHTVFDADGLGCAGERVCGCGSRGAGGGRRLIDLTVSNPTVCGFEYDADAILRPLADARALVYDPDPRGMRAAREAVAGYYSDHGATLIRMRWC